MADESNESHDDSRPLPSGAWVRESSGLEFDRVIFFTDAVFAIALTLLIVTIEEPPLPDPKDAPATMIAQLAGIFPKFASFFIAFVLIGRYWIAHHLFVGLLRAIDQRLIGINLVYLAFVAFLPFPVSLVGSYESNPVSVLLLGTCLAIVSSLEVLQFRHAYRKNLLREAISPESYKWSVVGSAAPVAIFVLSAPLAFISSTLCLTSWLLMIPVGTYIERKAPKEVGHFLMGGATPRTGRATDDS